MNQSKIDSAPNGEDPPLQISSEQHFCEIVEAIDRDLAKAKFPIPSRHLRALGALSKKLRTSLAVCPRDEQVVQDLFTPDQISLKLSKWMKARYGSRLDINGTIGRVAFPLRGSLYTLRIPLVFGTVRIVNEPLSFGVPRSPIGVIEPPTVNLPELVDDFTADLSRSLNGTETVQLAIFFDTGMNAFMALDSVRDVPLVSEAIGDLEAAVVHLMAVKQQCGLSKWASLQATEKVLKAFILSSGQQIQKSHHLADQAKAASALGLPPPPAGHLKLIQCPAGVRYGETAVTQEEAVRAHLASVEICEVAAREIARKMKRSFPERIEVCLDGMPLSQFLAKHGLLPK